MQVALYARVSTTRQAEMIYPFLTSCAKCGYGLKG